MKKNLHNFIKIFYKKQKSKNNNVLDLKSYINQKQLYEIETSDLNNLYNNVYNNKCLCVLEFGSGWSTLVIAKALYDLKKKYGSYVKKLRRDEKFVLHFIETSKKFLKISLSRIPEYIKKEITIIPHYSKCKVTSFNGQLCHEYEKFPATNPDFIYVDGPHILDVENRKNQLGFNKSYDFVPMSCDLLKIENLLLPGTIILFDGRVLNARFLKNNFKRNWSFFHSTKLDIVLMKLNEKPIGPYNAKMLDFKK
jgi:hypothetical protein